MSEKSAIEWTDTTWNPVRGCTKVSPGCANCYAETFTERWRGVKGHAYEQGFDLRLVPAKLDEPLRWAKPRRVFVNSMSDLFQDGVPDEYIDRVFAVIALCPQHTFQILTKRADRMRDYLWRLATRLGDLWDLTNQPTWIELPTGRSFPRYPENWPLPNVWLGVSVENQHFADERIPLLLQTPAAVRFVSVEPLLEEISFRWAKWDDHAPHPRRSVQLPPVQRNGKLHAGSVEDLDGLRMLDWIIVGGESGHSARTFRIEWARSIIEECNRAGVPVFMKQIGANPISALGLGGMLRNPKGGDMAEWPGDLRVRQFPTENADESQR